MRKAPLPSVWRCWNEPGINLHPLPRGCTLEVCGERDALAVTGNSCPKGKDYAISECLHPMRTVTALVQVTNRDHTMVSVKTESPVPKEYMMDVMEALKKVQVNAPVSIGTVVLDNLFGTRILVTKNIH